ncbi:MAG TPA: PHP domain-containing protein [Candidatus Lokiarchaeia archaeon]|nr:PHP domain-containing protein [Candidatus Lokiarchaeia archaeon]
MKRFDLHVHTEATAPYMQGDSNLMPYHEHGAARRLDFMGISDHVHYFWQRTRFFRAQRESLAKNNYNEPKVYLGAEQTILSRQGRIGMRKSGRDVLDYIILAIHWMPVGGRLDHDTIDLILKSEEKTNKLIAIAMDFYRNAMTNPKLASLPKIIGHPFNFIAFEQSRRSLVLDAIDQLCKHCAGNHVAFEINRDSIPGDLSSIDASHDDYWTQLVTSLNSYNVMVTLGSDAHRLENIGCIDPILACLERFQFKKSLLVDESFFDIK